MFSPLHLEGSNSFTGNTGTTLKSGAGMYISIDINQLPRKDLDFKFYDENEEYESNTIAEVIYRHPSDSNHMFLMALKKHLKFLTKKKRKMLL